jgi:F-type H+-transporting ATPase subunit a
MLIDSVSSKNYNYIILINFFFTTIFICNFAGLFPYSQTITAQIAFTFAFSMLIILTIWFNSFFANKILIFNHFLPNGSPLVIIPFIILIELVSNLSRIISLAVRLFANITSGHALLKILAGFTIAAFAVVGV